MEKEMTYIRYVNLKNSTIFGVGEFSIWWNVFEDEKCNCACSHEEILEAVQGITGHRKMAFTKFAMELKNRTKDLNSLYAVQQYVNKKLYPTDDIRARVSDKERNIYRKKVINFINSNGEDFLDGALLAIWRIRNNMFHGLKAHAELEDQVGLFRAIIDVLKEVIEG